MRKLANPLPLAALLSLMPCLAGCGHSPRQDAPVAAHDGHGGHDHDELGPHGGTLIELGSESYHAELLHDDPTHAVTVFLLDGSARRPAAASELPRHVLLNVMIAGAPRQYSLPCIAGNHYAIVDELLCESLCDNDDARARLNATIGGKTFVGNVEPHAHDGHEHGHAQAPGNRVR
ncbi:MAG TPA: hypothetical protein VIK18_12150 [Pirellulales bacterium]